ncbi:MAG: hypothetical protein FWD05_05475 [Oscillospiraceae bacterium]|nr:hypothetical protein [Oscillospiraceae bacterium]
MRNFLQRFMMGRYGPDHLSVALMILGFVLSLLYAVIGFLPVLYISYFTLGLAIFRTLSRNIIRRRKENDIFIRYWWPIRTKIKNLVARVKQLRTHKRFKCPNCKNKLRVPRGKGKLQVTCPKCGEGFFRRS